LGEGKTEKGRIRDAAEQKRKIKKKNTKRQATAGEGRGTPQVFFLRRFIFFFSCGDTWKAANITESFSHFLSLQE
jgi:hypothetical protein